MKITGKAYRELDKQIKDVFDGLPIGAFHMYLIHISENKDVKSIGVRFIWDIFYRAMHSHNYSWKDIAETEGVKMSHLQTALKRIISKYYPPIKSYLKEVE